jgi:signal transduction protein with GAF and PtsI domain
VPTATAFDGIERDPTDRSFERTFGRLRDDLGRAVKRLEHAPEPAVGGALDRFALALCDARLREQFAASADRPSALRAVAKEYARASHRLSTSGLGGTSSDYAAELEELCALLGDAQALRPGAIWIADRIGAFVALIAVARGASAVVASDAITPTAIAITRAARIPAISDVPGLFSWARPNDLVAVDGDHGIVLVHPAPSDIERLRQTR